MDRIEAFILAGGASSRMGTDKSQMLIGQQTFLDKIGETLLAAAASVTVVGRDAGLSGFKTVPDIYPQWGALGGLHAALHACQTEWALIVACDLPFITPELCQHLASVRADHDAVVPVQEDGRPQPLCALYRVSTCLPVTNSLIQAAKRRPLDLLEAIQTRWVTFAEIEDLQQSAKFFVNINTPEDYYEATRKPASEL